MYNPWKWEETYFYFCRDKVSIHFWFLFPCMALNRKNIVLRWSHVKCKIKFTLCYPPIAPITLVLSINVSAHPNIICLLLLMLLYRVIKFFFKKNHHLSGIYWSESFKYLWCRIENKILLFFFCFENLNVTYLNFG